MTAPNYERPAFTGSLWKTEPKVTAAPKEKSAAEKLEKPPRGSAKLERIVRQKKADAKESAAKTAVRKRDKHCRWPHFTDEARELCRRSHSEAAHLNAKGGGGDKLSLRSTPKLLINVCAPVHQGPGSLHAGDRKVGFLTPEKANGPLVFFERRRGEKWAEVGRELFPGVLAPKKDVR
jgi:hypothetical protein